jgi:polyisoprenoid-binding protein YceI
VKGIGGLRVGATATTRIKRLEYGLKWNQLIETGPVVGDEVTVTIDLEVVRPALPGS